MEFGKHKYALENHIHHVVSAFIYIKFFLVCIRLAAFSNKFPS